MPFAVWSGHLQFGLVAMPVRLLVAARTKTTRFRRLYRKPINESNLLSSFPSFSRNLEDHDSELTEGVDETPPMPEETSGRIGPQHRYSTVRQVFQSEATREEIRPNEMVKGYEIKPNEFVAIDPQEVRAAEIETSDTIDLFHFVNAAFDETTSRLFIGTHKAAEMIAMDSKSGKEIAHLPTAEGMDGVYFDSLRNRIYVSGGRGLPAGFAYVYQQTGADHYETIGKISTRGGAGTSFWSPQLDRYYVAAPATDKEEAAILVYAPQN